MKLTSLVSASLLLATLSSAQPHMSFDDDVLAARSLNTKFLDQTTVSHAADEVQADFTHVTGAIRSRDVDHLGSNGNLIHKRAHGSKRAKKCSSKSKGKSNSSSSDAGTASKITKSSSSGSDSSKSSSSSKAQNSSKSSSDDSDDSSKSSKSSSSSDSLGKGLIGMLKFAGSSCAPDASTEYPNGNINFLNCGLQKSGSGNWHPPSVKLNQVKVLDSDSAASSSTFKACKKYKSAFDSASAKTGVPATFLMAFAMQESSCQQGETGPNGEIGLMQLTTETAKSLGVSNPHDVNQNALGGAKYFKQLLDQSQNNVLLAVGQYNGWQDGMSYHQATNRGSPCAQNNLDYLNQFFNGWIQGKDGDSIPKIFNNMKTCKD